MPTYCYRPTDSYGDDDDIIEMDFPMGKAPSEIHLDDGGTADRDYQAEHVGGIVKGTKTPVKPSRGPWPMKPCYASGVHASQAQELRDHLANRGCSTEVTNDGDPIYTSAAHRKKALKIRGMHDRNSFN